MILIGCQPQSGDITTLPPKESSAIEGNYRLKATPDQIAEVGVDSLPQLIIASDHWRMVIDDTESSGTWQYEGGVLKLSDKSTGETTAFKVDESATELTASGEDPIIFVKYGVANPSPEAE